MFTAIRVLQTTFKKAPIVNLWCIVYHEPMQLPHQANSDVFNDQVCRVYTSAAIMLTSSDVMSAMFCFSMGRRLQVEVVRGELFRPFGRLHRPGPLRPDETRQLLDDGLRSRGLLRRRHAVRRTTLRRTTSLQSADPGCRPWPLASPLSARTSDLLGSRVSLPTGSVFQSCTDLGTLYYQSNI